MATFKKAVHLQPGAAKATVSQTPTYPRNHPHWDGQLLDACDKIKSDVARQALKMGANPNLVGAYGRDPLLACLSAGIEATAGRRSRIDHIRGVDSPLAEAAALIATLLLDSGASPLSKDSDDSTALILAARAGAHSLIPRLVSGGADIDAVDSWGRTALIWSAATNHPKCAQALLDLGADPARRSHRGLDALDYAKSIGGDAITAWSLMMEPYFEAYREKQAIYAAALPAHASVKPPRL